MRFMVLHNRHHKVSQSVPFFMQRKTVTILLRVRIRGHFVLYNTKYHESHYDTVFDNPQSTATILNDIGDDKDDVDGFSKAPFSEQ